MRDSHSGGQFSTEELDNEEEESSSSHLGFSQMGSADSNLDGPGLSNSYGGSSNVDLDLNDLYVREKVQNLRLT